MDNLSANLILMGCILICTACQQQNINEQTPSNGKVLAGNAEGVEFMIAMGNEDEKFMGMIEAFNQLDAEALWAHSADTITMYGTDGNVRKVTQQDMAGFFSSADSISWNVEAVIPVKSTNSEDVNILSDSFETIYFKDGTVDEKRLFERFVFKNEKLVAVYQWDGAMPQN